MKPYSIALEIAPEGRCYAHVLDLPGCMLRAPSQEETLRKLPETIREYYAWLRRHGETTPQEEASIEIEVVEVRTDGGPFDPGDTAALFEQDKQPLTPEVMEQHFRLAAYNRADLLELVRHLPEDLLDWQPTPNTFSIRRVLRHIGNGEEWYVSPALFPRRACPPNGSMTKSCPSLSFWKWNGAPRFSD
jgi:predicted RNase H-like HicB family nuclease